MMDEPRVNYLDVQKDLRHIAVSFHLGFLLLLLLFFFYFKIQRNRELTLLAYESRPVPTTVFSYFCVSGIPRSDSHTKLEAGPWCNAA